KNQAASLLKRLAKARFFCNRLHPRVDDSFRLFAPKRNQSPLQHPCFASLLALHHRKNILRRRDVVARRQGWQIGVFEIDDVDPAWLLKCKSAAHVVTHYPGRASCGKVADRQVTYKKQNPPAPDRRSKPARNRQRTTQRGRT